MPLDETARPSFDPDALLKVLDRHDVEYVVVGGVAARAHGATRRTSDLDVVPSGTTDNLNRLASALRELNARLRVGGMTDEEARRLPVEVNEATLRSFGSSTWMTDAGPLDLLAELRDRNGRALAYSDLLGRASVQRVGAVTVQVAGLDDIIEAKQFAAREKDKEALPELRALRPRDF